MKKSIFLLIAILVAININAQIIKIYKGTELVEEYKFSEADSVAFDVEYESVDLGLPSGTLWATCNIGASKPEEYGDYFAWGETKAKTVFSEATYKYYKSTSETTKDNDGFDVTVNHMGYTKYVTSSDASTYGYDGTFYDDKTTLEFSDDAATVNMGSKWRIPTLSEWQELNEKCTWTWTTLSGVNGYKVKAANGNYIFLPAAGTRGAYDLNCAGYNGYYWSSSLSSGTSLYAFLMDFVNGYRYTNDYNRYEGRSVRAVRSK